MATVISNLVDLAALDAHIEGRVVNVQEHPVLPLKIYNYGQKATFESIWDDVTCAARGLIVNAETGEIVARPFRKFFNLGTGYRPETDIANLPATEPEVTEKLDGSLGILYRFNDYTGISTRGSFMSDQSAWATAWYGKHLFGAQWPDGWTPLFEIIYPDNRIVVDYEYEGLVLIGCVNIETGEEMRHRELAKLAGANGCRVSQLYNKSLAEMQSEQIASIGNFEGYVLTWHFEGRSPLKVKVKLAEYMRLHHLLTGISPKEIWRMLSNGESFDEITNNVPAHYREWVIYWKNGLEAEYGRIEQTAKAIWGCYPGIKSGTDREARKQFAEYVLKTNSGVAAILFAMLDDSNYEEKIWKLAKEKTAYETPFKPVNE